MKLDIHTTIFYKAILHQVSHTCTVFFLFFSSSVWCKQKQKETCPSVSAIQTVFLSEPWAPPAFTRVFITALSMALVCPAAKTRNDTYKWVEIQKKKSHWDHARLYRISCKLSGCGRTQRWRMCSPICRRSPAHSPLMACWPWRCSGGSCRWIGGWWGWSSRWWGSSWAGASAGTQRAPVCDFAALWWPHPRWTIPVCDLQRETEIQAWVSASVSVKHKAISQP